MNDSDDSDDFKPSAAKKKAAIKPKVEKKASPIKAIKASPVKRTR
jgi:hypothetical protein